MAISVNPTTLTSGNLAKQQAELRKRKGGLDKTASSRRDVLKQLQQAQRGRMNPLLIQKLRTRLGMVTKQVGAQQKTYKDYYSGTYRPYEQSYTQFQKLDKANPQLDQVLNQLTPFDPQAASERMAAQSQLNQQLISSKQGRDELAGDYATGQRQLETVQPDRFRAILSNYAGRGMARSTGYASAYGDEAADFAKRRTDLDTQNQRGQAQYSMADAGAQSDYLANLAGIIAGTTGRLSADAGQLGLAGNTNLPLLLELARRRLAAQGG